jgi:hypothetical protein
MNERINESKLAASGRVDMLNRPTVIVFTQTRSLSAVATWM